MDSGLVFIIKMYALTAFLIFFAVLVSYITGLLSLLVSGSKIGRVILNVTYCVTDLILVFIWLYPVMILFVFSSFSILVAVLLYFLIKKSSFVNNRLSAQTNKYFKHASVITIIGGLFLVSFGATLLISLIVI